MLYFREQTLSLHIPTSHSYRNRTHNQAPSTFPARFLRSPFPFCPSWPFNIVSGASPSTPARALPAYVEVSVRERSRASDFGRRVSMMAMTWKVGAVSQLPYQTRSDEATHIIIINLFIPNVLLIRLVRRQRRTTHIASRDLCIPRARTFDGSGTPAWDRQR